MVRSSHITPGLNIVDVFTLHLDNNLEYLNKSDMDFNIRMTNPEMPLIMNPEVRQAVEGLDEVVVTSHVMNYALSFFTNTSKALRRNT